MTHITYIATAFGSGRATSPGYYHGETRGRKAKCGWFLYGKEPLMETNQSQQESSGTVVDKNGK